MTDNDAKLEQFLRADLPPARDPLFRITVLARLESRRFRRQVAIMVGVGVAATALVTFNAAAINAWLAEDVTRVALGVVVAGGCVDAPGTCGFRSPRLREERRRLLLLAAALTPRSAASAASATTAAATAERRIGLRIDEQPIQKQIDRLAPSLRPRRVRRCRTRDRRPE